MIEDAEHRDFLSNPEIIKNYLTLQQIGVFKHIDKLHKDIKDCRNLLSGAVDIFNKTTIDEILDAAVWKISDQFLPSFITFLWKPHRNREDLTIKSYKDHKLVDLDVPIRTIVPFEDFFRSFPKPIAYEIFAYQLKDSVAPGVLQPLEQLNPEILIPIMGPSGLYGIVMVGRKMLVEGYTLEELFFLEQIMSFLSQAIQNHLHYEDSVRDVKTGLFNHGYFMNRLNEEVARTKREAEVSSLLVMDVDNFKKFNDTYGHLAGDRILESLASTIKQSVRTEDIPSRFGGEEFTILLPNTPRQIAWLVAERLRDAVASMKVSWESPLPQVTISLGVVSFDNRTNASPDEIIKRADEALYQSKENGRNRTTVWGAGLLFRIQRGQHDSVSASA
ncbi:MAG: sensor domain-containing diguanylate cyclase [Treponema sp.]|jgi:diguanylate cyclase (GGDEF)-like protein|nr:sensor domain-containing diguanylate cyclase [Treponema sp.]